MAFSNWVHNTNLRVARSPVGKWFRLEGCGHPRERKGSYFFTELRAGLATFFAMAYIISVNSNITSITGGTCVCPEEDMGDFCAHNAEYAMCTQEVNRDLVTATAAIAALSTFCMGFFANLPIALAPGMGLNAYFAYTVVGPRGSGMVSYSTALTAVFVEGWVFLGLTLCGMRQWLARALPKSIKLATGVGIGLYLALIGLTYSAGIGLVQGGVDTPIELAGCISFNEKTGLCDSSDKMRNPTMWIGIFCGGILTALLMMYRIKGAVIIGILLVSIISWPRTTPVTFFPYTDLGTSKFDFFKQVVTFHPIQHTLLAQDWNLSGKGSQFGLAFITFLYVDILDTTGTMYSMARFAGAINEETQDFEGSAMAYMVDAISISIGSLLGSPPVTAFVESGAGISEGGKTGLTSCVTGLAFFVAVFFAPIFASIPPWATGCTLVIVGAMMAKAAADINWRYYGDAIPAFLTIAIMPFTYSIAYGLIAGITSYITLNGFTWCLEKISGGRIVPPNKDESDPWSWKIKGGFLPPWVNRAAHGKKDFWKADEEYAEDRVASGEAVSFSSGSEERVPLEKGHEATAAPIKSE
ncbi:Xanthine/uracil/vitamin C permease [Penicillium cf. griseofulvum]|uniref:Xanthine/uracil/vitamin C permease n=1 Tax=Penicillium cf. griseofulvum TaxID=2972120 RepID=A0A9W9MF95_9EURO|nr:Xanthine/uracil/vitamin C permease [Penicillium cf. griseofulvum]KAJ5424252.1 Xanthine/uracil/vitamin C permease [Penicillium cf. griseofulvum]KAJ5442508.1 Xanthine/uracil/vitamin C permease [Penicillium cf. griseofulvum]